MLVVEPLRWALAIRPRWIALEQVPPVLVIWDVVAEHLRDVGYWVWTGVLSSETFGVPQTRRRAFLIASLDGPVQPPAATHQMYRPGEPAAETADTLMGPGLKPWVSMAEALGWGMSERPVTTLTAGTSRQGGVNPLDGGAGARATLKRERERGAWRFRLARGAGMTERYGDRPDTPQDQPAPTITSKARTASWVYVNGNQQNVGRRGGA
jgi:DNA (cytosine-5)-methyltransferase 1